VSDRARHLNEERLIECYVAEQGDHALDPRVAEHLADCVECRTSFSELSQFMDALRSEADADTDAVFPAEWRRQQQQQIASRLEHLGHAARVFSFPGRSGDTGIGTTARIARRWIAAAAAAGLFVGAALGSYYDLVSSVAPLAPTERAVSGPVRVSSSPTPTAADPVEAQRGLDDDAFLSELELAVDGPHTRELVPFYAFTPLVVEASAPLR
jgi:anti-sigma factor RsiW